MKTSTILILCAIVLVILGLTNWYSYNSGLEKCYVKDSTVVFYDSIPVSGSAEIPEPIIVIKEAPSIIDTAAILSDYFSEKSYDITERTKDYVFRFKPVVSNNQLLSLDFEFKNLKPTTLNYYSPRPKFMLFGGVSAGERYIAPQVSVSFRDKWLFQANYNLINSQSRTYGINIGISYRIF